MHFLVDLNESICSGQLGGDDLSNVHPSELSLLTVSYMGFQMGVLFSNCYASE